MLSQQSSPSQLMRRLGLADAVMIGLGAMLGAGVFTVVAPVAALAGHWAFLSLGFAAIIAYCNAVSVASLAACYPESGGVYVYARERLGIVWGCIAGICFLCGKLASCAVMALTLGAYLLPGYERWVAAGAVIVLTGINYCGIEKTARWTYWLVMLVLAVLALVVVSALMQAGTDYELTPASRPSTLELLQAAGLWFFAFAGYARLATLADEVQAPERILIRAIPLALGVVLAIYFLVSLAVFWVLPLPVLATSTAPLGEVVAAGPWPQLLPWVQIGAAAACLGVLLSLLAGISRTAFAMAKRGHLPRFMAAVHPVFCVPHHAQLLAGGLIVCLLLWANLSVALVLSATLILVYYALANLSALRLGSQERRWPWLFSLVGLLGCVLLVFSLIMGTLNN